MTFKAVFISFTTRYMYDLLIEGRFHQKTCDHKTLTLVLIIVFAIIVMDHDNFFMKTVD